MSTNHIVTSCKDCKFAQYEGKTQVDCTFDLLDKYKNAGIQVIEAEDEEKEFFVINRICMYSRHKTVDITPENVVEHIKVKYQIIIILNDNIEQFENTIKSIKNQDIPPQHITIIKPYVVNVQPFVYTKILKNTNIAWRYQDVVNPETPILDSIDSCLDQKVFPYYIAIHNGFELPKQFSLEFNWLVNEKFITFTFLSHEKLIIVPTIYHKQLSGNSFSPLFNKIREDEKLRKGIYWAGDLIQCLQ